MNRRDLQHGQILLVGKVPEKVDTLQIEPAVQLIEHFCPPADSSFRLSAIADAVIADDQHLRRRPPFEHSWQRTHEHMKAAVRFEVARALGDDCDGPGCLDRFRGGIS